VSSGYRIRARRTVGEMLAEMPKAQGTRGQLVGPGVIGPSSAEGLIDEPATLSEMGISYTESSRMQTEAMLPWEDKAAQVARLLGKSQQAISASESGHDTNSSNVSTSPCDVRTKIPTTSGKARPAAIPDSQAKEELE